MKRALPCLLALAAGAAAAHDTWFERQPGALALGTGAHYPNQETSIGPALPASAGCRGSSGDQPLRVRAETPQALLLAPPARAEREPTTCWAQLPPLDIELDAGLVARYLDEIRASADVRARWADQQRRGVRWQERYAKHARVELGPAGAAPAPVPMAMDVVLAGAPRAGERLCFQLQRDGQPLPGQAVELTSGRLPAGFWLRTDAEGRACAPLPLGGDWLLRGTDLRPDPDRPDAWASRFFTLAFHAAERPATRANLAPPAADPHPS